MPGGGQRARVAREAQVTGRLGDHPHVITVYDTGEHDGVPFLILRAMRGGSLADRLAAGRLPVTQVVRIGRELALALDHAHRAGIVHRDVKPSNAWLAENGSVALGDFGVATGGDPAADPGAGSVRYLAPERVRGEPATPATDLYALGATLYECLVGRPPFVGRDAAWVLAQHRSADPEPFSWHGVAVVAALERLVMRLLAKDPADRPASAAALAEALAAITPARGGGARRLVTVVGVRGDASTEPELTFHRLARCADHLRAEGATVQWHLGTVLVGLFGLDGVAEDEPLRAARAAAGAMGAHLRVGAEVGDVFVQDAAVTGPVVAVAASLADGAAAGEVHIGAALRAVLGDAASVDPSGRLRSVSAPGARPPDRRIVGRTSELAWLRDRLEDARGGCELVAVVGAGGVGKSRLLRAFADELDTGVQLLVGSCRRPGEGTTRRVLTELVGGVGAELERFARAHPRAGRAVRAAVGVTTDPTGPEEAAWALRGLLGRLAERRAVVVVVEDVQWAEPDLLGLLRAVADDGPAGVLVVLSARPPCSVPADAELALRPLPDDQALELAEQAGADPVGAARIVARAEGNPLFVEQLVAVDAGDGELPASIAATLTALLDRLAPDQRELLQCAAVQGRTFHAGAVAAVTGRSAGVERDLRALVRRDLIDPDRSEFPREAAFRFSQSLLRDAAYAAMTKRDRAGAHAAVAHWLQARPGGPVEVVAHHLERVIELRHDLGEPADGVLEARALAHLRDAARLAVRRGTPLAAVGLLERARALEGPDGATTVELAVASFEAGDAGRAAMLLDAVIEASPAPVLGARARIERETIRLETGPGADAATAEAVVAADLGTLEAAEDGIGVARAWLLRGAAAWQHGRVAAADRAWRAAADAAGSAGAERQLVQAVGWRAAAAVSGPTPVPEAIARCHALRERVAHSPIAEGWIVMPLACLHAMAGDAARAEALLAEGRALLDEVGTRDAGAAHLAASVALSLGRPAAAATLLEESLATLTGVGATGFVATTHAMVAQALVGDGRAAEATPHCDAAAAAAAPDDVLTQAIWRAARARALATTGDPAALPLSRAAVALLEPTDLLTDRADAMLDRAHVLHACGRPAAATQEAAAAVDLLERKGNVAAAHRARAVLEGDARARET